MATRPARRGSTLGIRQLKAELSQQLRRVEAGETITVTDRGRVIATIHPVETAEEAEAVGRVRELAASGKVSWSGGKPTGSSRPVKLRRSATVSDAVLEDRR